MVSLHTETARFKSPGHKNEFCFFRDTLLFRKKLAKETDVSNSIICARGQPSTISGGQRDIIWRGDYWGIVHTTIGGVHRSTHNYWGLNRTQTETQLLRNWTHRQGVRLLLTIEGGDSLLPEGSLPLLYVGETSIVGRGKSHQQDCGVKKNILAVEGAFSEAICEDASFFVRMTIYKKNIMLHKCLILASGKSPNHQKAST